MYIYIHVEREIRGLPYFQNLILRTTLEHPCEHPRKPLNKYSQQLYVLGCLENKVLGEKETNVYEHYGPYAN